MEMQVKIDATEAKQMIAKCLEPGCVLLPAAAVEALCMSYDIDVDYLVGLGGIEAQEAPDCTTGADECDHDYAKDGPGRSINRCVHCGDIG